MDPSYEFQKPHRPAFDYSQPFHCRDRKYTAANVSPGILTNRLVGELWEMGRFIRSVAWSPTGSYISGKVTPYDLINDVDADARSPLEVWLCENNLTSNFCSWFRENLNAPGEFSRGWAGGSMSVCSLLAPTEVGIELMELRELREILRSKK